MACTPGNLLTDSCTCLGMSEPCDGGSYCYDGQCTTQNQCGAGICTTACACVSASGKVAQKCEGNNKYCKNGKVMTLCTKDSLYTDECACLIGDAGICMGSCADGVCYGVPACKVSNTDVADCICAPENKKVGHYKKGLSTECTAEGVLRPIEGGCANDAASLSQCKCSASEGVCEGGSFCGLRTCGNKCSQGECNCVCTEVFKFGVQCTGDKNQCVNGQIVAKSDTPVCSPAQDKLDYCQCSAESANVCGELGVCDGADCYRLDDLLECSRNGEESVSCECSGSGKMTTVARAGEVCNDDGSVSRKCADGVPSLLDACKCGSFDGPECKKGDVCIGSTCYGTGAGVTGGYCEYGKTCNTACVCADASFTSAELCSGSAYVCNQGKKLLNCSAGQGQQNGECKACDVNCLECLADRAVCTKCADNFSLADGKCKNGGLSGGAIAGIAIAAVVVLAGAGVGIFFLVKHIQVGKKPKQQQMNPTQQMVLTETE